jgi:hypothetical protein
LFYIYNNNPDDIGCGDPVIDEKLTATATAIDSTIVKTNIYFTRTEDDTKPPKIPPNGSVADDGKIEVKNEENKVIIWYDDESNILKNEEGIALPYLWQCTQMVTKAGNTTYNNPVLIKTKQMINSIELYYL